MASTLMQQIYCYSLGLTDRNDGVEWPPHGTFETLFVCQELFMGLQSGPNYVLADPTGQGIFTPQPGGGIAPGTALFTVAADGGGTTVISAGDTLTVNTDDSIGAVVTGPDTLAITLDEIHSALPTAPGWVLTDVLGDGTFTPQPLGAVPPVAVDDTVDTVIGRATLYDPVRNDDGLALRITLVNGAAFTPGTPITLGNGALLTILPDLRFVHYMSPVEGGIVVTFTVADMVGNTDTETVNFNTYDYPVDQGSPYYSSSGTLSRFEWRPSTGVITQITIGTPQPTYNAWGVPGFKSPPFAYGNTAGGGPANSLAIVDLTTGSASFVAGPANFSSTNRGDYDWRVSRLYVIQMTGAAFPNFSYNFTTGVPVAESTTGANVESAVSRFAADVIYMPTLDRFFDSDSIVTGNGTLGQVTNAALANFTWTTFPSLNGIIPAPYVGNGNYGAGYADPYGNAWVFFNDTLGVTTLLALRIEGTAAAPTVPYPTRSVAPVTSLGGFNDGGANSQLASLLTYAWVATNGTGVFANTFQYPVNMPFPYTNPINIASGTSRAVALTAPDVIRQMDVDITNWRAGDELFINGDLPVGLTWRANVISPPDAPAYYRLSVVGPGTGAQFNTVLRAIQYVTTTSDVTPRTIQVTATQIDGVQSLRAAQTTIYLV